MHSQPPRSRDHGAAEAASGDVCSRDHGAAVNAHSAQIENTGALCLA